MYALLKPFDIEFDFETAKDYGLLGGNIAVFHQNRQTDWAAYEIAILGVEEERNAINNEGTRFAPDQIRKSLYEMFPGNWTKKIIDLGNIITGKEPEQTYQNVSEVVSQLIKNQISVILLGGSQDITYALTKSFDIHNKAYNLCVIDSIIDSAVTDKQTDNGNYLTEIITNDSSLLHDLSIFGIQTYYNHPTKFEIFDRLYVDYFKLGEIQQNIADTEPEIREADIVSIDINAIRNADMPAQTIARPNGINGYDICIMTRLAGIASRNKILGIFEYNPYFDKNKLGANLIAQMIWYYIEGKNAYIPDYPEIPKKELIKFYVNNDLIKLNFYKNPKTGRWWFEIPDITKHGQLFACSEKDYKQAVALKISERIYHIINKTGI